MPYRSAIQHIPSWSVAWVMAYRSASILLIARLDHRTLADRDIIGHQVSGERCAGSRVMLQTCRSCTPCTPLHSQHVLLKVPSCPHQQAMESIRISRDSFRIPHAFHRMSKPIRTLTRASTQFHPVKRMMTPAMHRPHGGYDITHQVQEGAAQVQVIFSCRAGRAGLSPG